MMPKVGFKHTAETRAKMSASRMGHPGYMLGKRHDAEARAKVSASLIGNKRAAGVKRDPALVARLAAAKRGKKIRPWPLEARVKVSGPRSHKWQGGLTDARELLESTPEYKNWRRVVFQRDDYTCRYCLERGGFLHAHHIKSYAQYPELRTTSENGITLCEACHRELHRQGGDIE